MDSKIGFAYHIGKSISKEFESLLGASESFRRRFLNWQEYVH